MAPLNDCVSLLSLPDELLLEVIAFLDSNEITTLQLLCRRLLEVCRDDSFWRGRCLVESSFFETMNLKCGDTSNSMTRTAPSELALNLEGSPDPYSELVSAPQLSTQWAFRGALEGGRKSTKERIRIGAKWDPTISDENVNWYEEYIHRNGPIRVSWFQQPRIRTLSTHHALEVKGMAIYEPNHLDDELFALSPLEDGSVCLWDIKATRGSKGSIVSQSSSGLLSALGAGVDMSKWSTAHECVSVDSKSHRAFFAVQSRLIELDLETFQVVGNQGFEWTITALSAAQSNVPLTVGTFNGIHLYDSRRRHHGRLDHPERVDTQLQVESLGLSGIFEAGPLPPYAPLAQSGPQSILHLEMAGSKESTTDDIFVAGRFSSILHYDRRMFPAIKGSMHSGARLCCLASLSYPFASFDGELGRRGEFREEEADKAKGRILIACGEYNSKGSLEMYDLALTKSPWADQRNPTMKNRQTASRSKLLSVVNHGTRIVVSDGQGYLKWFERDGYTEVRRHRIGHGEKVMERSLFASMPGSDEIAIKILSTKTGQGDHVRANDDDIMFWTGERLGLVDFSAKPGFTADDFEDLTKTPDEMTAEREQELYGQSMRLALERQANDVHFVRYLGAGIRG